MTLQHNELYIHIYLKSVTFLPECGVLLLQGVWTAETQWDSPASGAIVNAVLLLRRVSLEALTM